MRKYTINLANTFYMVFIVSLLIWILIAAKIIVLPLVFGFFLP